jgi:putative ABC transport system permease protein
LPGIRRDADGKPLAAPELIVITELMKKGETVDGSNITMRGVDENSFKLRPNLKIVEGRKFNSGLRELIVGRGVSRQFTGITVGGTMKMRGSEWTVVGVFESGDAYESELWTDAGIAQTTFGRTGYSSVLAELDGDGGIDKITSAAKADPRLNIEVKTQQAYFSEQTKRFRSMINVLAGIVVVIMALGAIFAALNTMYSAVAARSREIAVLRAIGFSPFPVMISVMVEAIFLSIVGGSIGALIVYALFNNVALSTLGQNLAQVVFSFKVTPSIMLRGLLIAVAIGSIGGLLPSMRASRLPVTTALRES